MESSVERLVEKRDPVDRHTYLEDPDTRDIVERRFVKLIEAAIDIGTVVVRHEIGAPPASNPETMQLLVDTACWTSSWATRWRLQHASETCWRTRTAIRSTIPSFTTPFQISTAFERISGRFVGILKRSGHSRLAPVAVAHGPVRAIPR